MQRDAEADEMPEFCFFAPDLYDASAVPLRDPEGHLHDAPGVLAPLGRQRRLMVWLRDQLCAKGVTALGPHAGENGWALSVAADDGFVYVLLDPHGGGARPFELIVDFAGAAEPEAEDTAQAVEALLTASPAVSLVEKV
jgi:hypothetical protein